MIDFVIKLMIKKKRLFTYLIELIYVYTTANLRFKIEYLNFLRSKLYIDTKYGFFMLIFFKVNSDFYPHVYNLF